MAPLGGVDRQMNVRHAACKILKHQGTCWPRLLSTHLASQELITFFEDAHFILSLSSFQVSDVIEPLLLSDISGRRQQHFSNPFPGWLCVAKKMARKIGALIQASPFVNLYKH